MGCKWHISAWVKPDAGGYTYVNVYQGDNPFAAFRAARKAKRSGAGCVKVEWR